MAANSTLLYKTEQALAAVVTAAAVGTDNIYTGSRSGDKAAPCVICIASEAGEDDPPASGNKWVSAVVMVKYVAAVDADGVSPESPAATLRGNVFDAIQTNTLAADLTSSVSGFTCQGAIFDGTGFEQTEDCWADSINLRLYCCCADV